ncbi:MAG: hypothetical protein J6T36_02795 [Campylobacter sp.]|nr:hypothetical protein [Campylobacter sp.]
MVRKLLLFCSVAFFISCSDTQNKSSDKCSDGAIQFDIIAVKSNMPTTEEEINFSDVYCANDTVTYVYTINDLEELPTIKEQKELFDEMVKDELLQFFCNENSIDLYTIKKNDMSLKWQYFLKDEPGVFSEFSVNKSMCEK